VNVFRVTLLNWWCYNRSSWSLSGKIRDELKVLPESALKILKGIKRSGLMFFFLKKHNSVWIDENSYELFFQFESFYNLLTKHNGENRMLDKSLLLRQMRKHAQTFSSAVKQVNEEDADINQALSLIEMVEKDSKLVAFRKMSFKTPSLLKDIFLGDNLTGLRSEIEKRLSDSKYLNLYETQGKKLDELEKIKRAEKKLKRVLDTKNC